MWILIFSAKWVHFAIMKIIQEDDQRQIASATESTSRELISQLTSLNVGDAVLGWSMDQFTIISSC